MSAVQDDMNDFLSEQYDSTNNKIRSLIHDANTETEQTELYVSNELNDSIETQEPESTI